MELPVIPWILLDTAQAPAGRALTLHQRGHEYVIRAGADELMNSTVHGSEESMAKLACGRLANVPGARVLVGGLGMGYTLAATLKCVAPDTAVVVAELVPAVVAWNRGPLAHLASDPLSDSRVQVEECDVAELIRKGRGAYDAILLDVDNGPVAMTRERNGWLYTREGLLAAKNALRAEGALAIWSASPNDPFVVRLRDAGFTVNEWRLRVREEGGRACHTVWVARLG